MKARGLLALVVALVGILLALPAGAAEPLKVGTKEAPPFVVRRADGSLDGPSIRLWRELAEGLGVTYTLEERDLTGLLDGVRDGSLDVAVAAITVTSEREATMDFTHAFHTTGLAIVARKSERSLWVAVADTLLSRELLQLVALLGLIQLFVGTLVWLLERRHNATQFPEAVAPGVVQRVLVVGGDDDDGGLRGTRRLGPGWAGWWRWAGCSARW